MERIHAILKHKEFLKYLSLIDEFEDKRAFCPHNIQHFLDTARIGYIFALENNFDIGKENIYAAALLHDIGRWLEYKEGIPHAKAGAELSERILYECGFSKNDAARIMEAILSHCDERIEKRRDLTGILYKADKASRNCMICKVKDKCSRNNKNEGIEL